MPEQLSQAQIDALLKKMSSGEVAVEEKQTIKEYDFKSPKKFTKEQLKAMDGLHETFSRLLSSYLSGILRIGCDVQVLQIDVYFVGGHIFETADIATSYADGGGQIDLPADSPEDQLADVISLNQVVEKLEDKDRALIELRYYSGMTQVQTAARLGMTQVQVSRREKKILGILRQQLL